MLRAELSLQQRGEAVRALETRAQRLETELQQARLASSRAVKQFEKRTLEGTYHTLINEVKTPCLSSSS